MSTIQSLSSISFSSDDETLKPIKNRLLPPNQIITKYYEPDQKPQLKLIKLQNKENNLMRIQETSDQQRKYNINFHFQDTLGFCYTDNLQKNMLYLKFNNKKYLKCPSNHRNYMAGLFIPLPSLLKSQLRKNKFLYRTLQGLGDEPVEYEHNVENSFGTNCFSIEPEIKFSSNYESSNLFMAIKKKPFEYDLILQNDINSKGTTQWFNFAVNIFQEGTYKFNIVNLTKSSSLFQKGMQVPVFSFQEKSLNKHGWYRGCKNISYKKNDIGREGTQELFYYTLHFQYQSVHKYDTVIFSYGFPYTSLEVQKFFNKITFKKNASLFKIEKIKICQTLSGCPVYLYQLSHKKKNLIKSKSSNNFHTTHYHSTVENKHQPNQKGIVLIARQHPGQSQSSFILEGMITFLIQSNDHDNAKKDFVYYIVPILNVDGVYYGNYRTNLSGDDLNRNWKQPRRDFHPQVFYVKKYLLNVNRLTPLRLILDIHGHSSAFNSFFYGNPHKKQALNSQNPKLFPYFCSKRMKEISFLQSTFKVSEDKKNSARVVLSDLFPKALVYTLENSFYGYKKGKKVVEYTIDRYKRLGQSLMMSYIEYIKISQRNASIKQKWEKQIQQLMKSKNMAQVEVCSQSDSEAGQELLQMEDEYKKLQQTDPLLNGSLETKNIQLKCRSSNNFRLYYSKHRGHKPGINKLDSSLSPLIRSQSSQKIYNFSNFPSQASNYSPQGFLSIVKIETKNNLENKSKSNKQNQLKDQILEKEVSENGDFLPGVNIEPKSEKNTVRQINYIHQKEYLAKLRREKKMIFNENDSMTRNCLKTATISLTRQLKEK